MSITLILSIGTFVAILALLQLLRARSSTLEIRATDIVVATLPVLIFLLLGRASNGVRALPAINPSSFLRVSLPVLASVRSIASTACDQRCPSGEARMAGSRFERK